MFNREKTLFKGKTDVGSYQIVDMVYEGRKARVLFSGNRDAAFSGMPLDGEQEMLFDYIQRLFELVCFTRPRNILIIGGGTYTLPTALVNALPDIHIDSVEIDAGLDELAIDFFGYKPHPRMKIYHQDGKDFLKVAKKIYDMVIIDAFSHLQIPESLASAETAGLIKNVLAPNGILAMNLISAYHGRGAETLEKVRAPYDKTYKKVSVYPADNSLSLWSSQNFILVAEKGRPRKSHGLRFEEVKIP